MSLQNSSQLPCCCSDNYLGERGAEILAEALSKNEHIQELSLKGNDVGDAGVQHICRALLKRKCQINKLDLGNNRSGSNRGLRIT